MSNRDDLRKAIAWARNHDAVMPGYRIEALADAAEKYLATLPTEREIDVWDIRCVEHVPIPSVCIQYAPHVAVRYSEEDARKVAEDWRRNPLRYCIEVRKARHMVSA